MPKPLLDHDTGPHPHQAPTRTTRARTQHAKPEPSTPPKLSDLFRTAATGRKGGGTRTPGTVLTVAFRHIKPSWRRYIHYARLASLEGDKKMQKYCAAYDAMSAHDQRHHWPEDIIELTGVTPGELVGAVCGALFTSGDAEGNMVSSIAQPDVMTALVRNAKSKDGYRHAELFFRLQGKLPRDGKPASPITIYNNPQAAVQVTQGKQVVSGLLPMEQETMNMDSILGGHETDRIAAGPAFLRSKVVEMSPAEDDV